MPFVQATYNFKDLERGKYLNAKSRHSKEYISGNMYNVNGIRRRRNVQLMLWQKQLPMIYSMCGQRNFCHSPTGCHIWRREHMPIEHGAASLISDQCLVIFDGRRLLRIGDNCRKVSLEITYVIHYNIVYS